MGGRFLVFDKWLLDQADSQFVMSYGSLPPPSQESVLCQSPQRLTHVIPHVLFLQFLETSLFKHILSRLQLLFKYNLGKKCFLMIENSGAEINNN